MEYMISLVQTHFYSTLAVGILILLFFYRRPQIFMMIFLFFILIGITVYLVLGISENAVVQKKNLINKTDMSLFQ